MYHSIYDNFRWMTTFGDPNFLYHKNMTQVVLLTAVRLMQSPVLPFDPVIYAEEIRRHALRLERDLRLKKAPLEVTAESIVDKCDEWRRVARDLRLLASVRRADLETESLNRLLLDLEKSFLSSAGLPGRTWYKHLLFAPGMDTGYAPEAFPGVRYQANLGNWFEAANEVDRVAEAIDHAIALTREVQKLATSFTEGL